MSGIAKRSGGARRAIRVDVLEAGGSVRPETGLILDEYLYSASVFTQ